MAVTPLSFIVAKILKCHLVRHMIPVQMLYDSSRDHKMAACYSETAFLFPEREDLLHCSTPIVQLIR